MTIMAPDTRPWPERLINGWWCRYGPPLLQRPDEADTDYVVRLKGMDWRALPPPLRQYAEVMAGLASACALQSVLGVPFGELMPPPERN